MTRVADLRGGAAGRARRRAGASPAPFAPAPLAPGWLAQGMRMQGLRASSRVAFALLAAAVASGPAAAGVAAELTLAAGNPARLELAYWPAGGWRVRQDGRSVEIAFPGAVVDIATATLAGTLQPETVETVESGSDGEASRLRLRLGCDCRVAVQGDGTRLFIDIVGFPTVAEVAGPVSAAAPRIAPEPPRREAAATASAAITGAPGPIEETRARLLSELRRAADAGLVELQADAADTTAPDAADLPAGPVVPDDGSAPDAAPGPESAAAEAVAGTAAAAEGAPVEDLAPVSPATEAGGLQPTEPAAGAPQPGGDPTPAVEHTAADDALPEGGGERPSPLAAETAGDGAAGAALAAALAAPAGRCLDDRDFLLPDPLPAGRFAAELGRLRQTLVGEFDRANEQTALELARLYLAHGLGIEAERVVADFAPAAREAPLIAALGRLAEGVALPGPGLLAVPGCRGQHGLWQAVSAALAGRPDAAVVPEVEALGALEQMARGLRGTVAARLGLAAAASGRWDVAERMRAMAKRAVRPGDPEAAGNLALLEARLARARGDRDAELVQLALLRRARGAAGTEALIRLAELGRDRSAGDPLRLDLGALALAGRGTPEGEHAFLAEAELTGWVIGRDAAFDLLRHGREAGEVGEAAYSNALARLERELPVRESELPLAARYDADPAHFAPSLADPGFRLALARSYLRLGAPRLAEAVLRPGDLAAGAITADLAEAYLRTGDDGAAARLAAALDPGAARARTEAGLAVRRGEAAIALARLGSLGAPPDEIARIAWAAGDWPRAAEALGAAAPDGGSAGGASSGAELQAALQATLRLAIAARSAGATSPPEAASRLAAGLPGAEEAIGALFAAPASLSEEPSPEAVGAYLAPVAAEARIIAELLHDG